MKRIPLFLMLFVSVVMLALATSAPAGAQTSCPLGTYDDNGVCTPCPVGSYQDEVGQTSCKPADPGYYVALEGSVEQTMCPAGFTSDAGAEACYEITSTLPGGTSIDVDIDSPADGTTIPEVGGQPVNVTGTASVGEIVSQPSTLLVYVLDLSGSTIFVRTPPLGCGNNQNGDTFSNTVLDCEIAAAIALNNQAALAGTITEVGVAGFSAFTNGTTVGAAADLSPASDVQLTAAPGADVNNNAIPDISEVLRSAWAGASGRPLNCPLYGYCRFTPEQAGNTGGTAYSVGIRAALEIANASNADNKLIVFMSDGQNNSGERLGFSPTLAQDVVDSGAIFNTFAVGSGTSITCDTATSFGTLRDVSNLSEPDGQCFEVGNVADLPDLLPDLLNSSLDSLELTVTGGAPDDISADASLTLPQEGPVTVTFSTDVSGLVPGPNQVCVIANGRDGGGAGSATDCITINVNGQPDVDAGGPYIGNEGSPIPLSGATVVDPGDTPSINWTVDNTTLCSFDDATAVNPSLTCTDNAIVSVTLTADDGLNPAVESSATVTVNNVAPTATLGNNGPIDEGSSATVSFSGSFDPSSNDTAAGLKYAFDCAGGSLAGVDYATAGTSDSTSCSFGDNGNYTVSGKIIDKDGDANEYTTSVVVNNVAPQVATPVVTPEPSIEGDPAIASATFSDPADSLDEEYTCKVNYGDGNVMGTVVGYTCTGPAHIYSTPGSYVVTVSIRDKDGGVGSSSTTHVVDPRNTPPTAEAGGPYSGDEGAPIALDGTGSSDPDNDPLSYEWSVDNPVLCSFDNNLSATPNLTCDDNGSYTVTVSVSDNIAPAVTDTASVTVNNVAPTASFGNTGPVDEGASFELSLTSAYDPSSADTTTGFEYAFDCGDGSGYGAYGSTATATCATTDSGTRNVKGKIRDKDSGETEYLASVTVNNVAPTITSFEPTTLNPIVAINELVEFQATFTDPAGTADEDYTCAFDATDDGTADYSVTDADYGACSGSVSYAAPGVYTASLTVTDKDGGASTKVTYQFVVVYDPAAGFVTGGGWIDSPEGAYTADASLTGKASFGFVAKYKKGQTTPDGNTQFQFKAGALNFHSTSYDWLIVAGANAKFKGVGTINGAGEYSFMITATDGDLLGGGQADGFRIKIWDAGGTVYDNQMGQGDDSNDTTDLGGGSIVIHNK